MADTCSPSETQTDQLARLVAELANDRAMHEAVRAALAELRDAHERQATHLANARAEIEGQRLALAQQKRARRLAAAEVEQRGYHIECLARVLVAAGHELLVSDQAEREVEAER